MNPSNKIASALIKLGYRGHGRVNSCLNAKGHTISKTQLISEVAELLRKSKNSDLAIEFGDRKKEIISEVIIALNNNEQERKAEKIKKSSQEAIYNYKDSFDYSDLALGYDILKPEEPAFLWIKSTGQVTKIYPKTYLDSLTRDDKAMVLQNAVWGLLEYNPYNPKPSEESEYNGKQVIKFNAYAPPEWTYKTEVDAKPHPFFNKLMRHLFPREDTRKYVMQWIKNMIVARNETILVLVGPNGIGKNILSTHIFSALIGPHNRIHFGEMFFDSRFSDEVAEKKLVVFDETTIAKSKMKKERLKEMCNDTLSVEGKNKTRQVIKNYASFVVINNYENENYMVSRDRRFSFPEITDEPLIPLGDDGTVEKEIGEFVLALNDNRVVAALAKYILETDMSDFQNHKAWKKEKFWRVMYLSLSEWQKFIVNAIFSKEKEEYLLADIRDDYIEAGGNPRFFSVGEVNVNKFLTEEFTDLDGDIIGSAKRINNQILIVPSKKYLPTPKTDFDEVEIDDIFN